MAIYTTYDQVGKAEDVSDIISNISPFGVIRQNKLCELRETLNVKT